MPSVDEGREVFIVRIWREPRTNSAFDWEWRGVIEHLDSGDRRYFLRFEDMTEFVRAHAPLPAPDPDA